MCFDRFTMQSHHHRDPKKTDVLRTLIPSLLVCVCVHMEAKLYSGDFLVCKRGGLLLTFIGIRLRLPEVFNLQERLSFQRN